MKEKIITLLFCLFLAAAMITCDNGDPPNLDETDIENKFIVDYGSLTDTDKFFGEELMETEIGKM